MSKATPRVVFTAAVDTMDRIRVMSSRLQIAAEWAERIEQMDANRGRDSEAAE